MTAPLADARQLDIRLADGRRLRLYEAGDPNGHLVIAQHGTPCSGILARWWADDALARGIRLVGFDRAGYGGSDRRAHRTVADVVSDVAAIADHFEAPRFRTWGVSGGGPHALACAALLPDRVVAAATLASVAPYRADGLEWLAGMGQDNLDEFAAAQAGEPTLRPHLAQLREGILAAGPQGLADEMRSILGEPDVAVLSGDVASFLYEWLTAGQRDSLDGWVDDDLAFVRDWGFDPTAIRVPVLVLQGRFDLMVPYDHGRWLATRIPSATARLTDDDGHLTLITDVGRTHAWLLDPS